MDTIRARARGRPPRRPRGAGMRRNTFRTPVGEDLLMSHRRAADRQPGACARSRSRRRRSRGVLSAGGRRHRLGVDPARGGRRRTRASSRRCSMSPGSSPSPASAPSSPRTARRTRSAGCSAPSRRCSCSTSSARRTTGTPRGRPASTGRARGARAVARQHLVGAGRDHRPRPAAAAIPDRAAADARAGGSSAWTGIGAGLVLFASAAFAPGPLENYPWVDNPLGVLDGCPPALDELGVLLWFGSTLAAAASLVVRFRRCARRRARADQVVHRRRGAARGSRSPSRSRSRR